MTTMVSVVIPNRNKSESLVHCLAALFNSTYRSFEVIVVDDASEDESVQVAGRFPCTLVSLQQRVGAAEARNIGARHARGRLLFFIDSDCVVQRDTLATLLATDGGMSDPKVIVGGTYTEEPYDPGFFSFFQSVFIHYSETRHEPPDYVATHALAMHSEQFRRSGGFARHFLPILEDVDFSHRMRRFGFRLQMNPALQVRHDFRYGLVRSMQNAFNKARHWLVYSLLNRDLLSDSGAASKELKVNQLFFVLAGLSVAASGSGPAVAAMILNLFFCRRLISRFFRAGGIGFGLRAAAYFLFCYPVAIWAGAGRGLFDAAASRRALFKSPGQVGGENEAVAAGPLLETRK